METIFEHKVTIKELCEYDATSLNIGDYTQRVTNHKIAYMDIASLYANRGKWDLAEKYQILSGFYDSLPKGMTFDECLPYKLT